MSMSLKYEPSSELLHISFSLDSGWQSGVLAESLN